MSIITDEDVYLFACCPTKYYNTLNFAASCDSESLYISHIKSLSDETRRRISERISPIQVSKEQKTRGIDTNKFMKKGEQNISGGLLFNNEYSAEPFILERVNKSSKLGKHSYQIIDFLPSIQLLEEHKKKLAFQSYLLYFYLGFMPTTCKLINIKQEVIEFNPVNEFEGVRKIINEIKKLEYTKTIPSAYINQHCKICRWKDKCLNECIKKKDLSLLFGISNVTRRILIESKINNINDMANLDNNQIELMKDKGVRNVPFLIKQAYSYITKTPERIMYPNFPTRYPALYFDIEGQIDLNFQYLFGVYNEETIEYLPFWADEITNEKDAFFAFLKYLSKIKKYTLFHYGSYEKTAIRDLCFKYNISKKIEQSVLNSMVDIYSALKKCAAIPVPSYSLKDIAQFLGYMWHDKEALGANSIIWHNQWMKTNNLQCKERLKTYNKNDCEATAFVKNWLEESV